MTEGPVEVPPPKPFDLAAAEAPTDAVDRMLALGAALMPLRPSTKKALEKGWQHGAQPLSADRAVEQLKKGMNLGVHCGMSRIIVLDAENQPARDALIAAGFWPTVIPAKAQLDFALDPKHDKRGGAHFWLAVPEGVDAMALPTNRMGIRLPNGGLLDVLAGKRYAVAPPSKLGEAFGKAYAAAAKGNLDPAVAAAPLSVAPPWLFSVTDAEREAVRGAELEQLAGILAPDPAHERGSADAASLELTEQIDSVSWPDWLAGDVRLEATGSVDGDCGCAEYHWFSSDNGKSATLHEGCNYGHGAHIWNATMRRELDISGEHCSRLDLAAALQGGTRREAAASVGIKLGGDGDAELLAAAEADGAWLAEHGVKLAPVVDIAAGRASAAVTFGGDVIGVPAPSNPFAAAALPGLPAVDPLLPQYRARAEAEAEAGAELPLDHRAGYARGLLPRDLRPLRDAVTGPRASVAPADIEGSHGLVAEAVAAAVGGSKLRCLPDGKRWFSWAGNAWSDADQGAARAAVQGLLSRHRQGGAELAQRKIRAFNWKPLTQAQRLKLAKMDGYMINAEGDLVGPNGEAIEMLIVESAKDAESTPAQNAIISQIAAFSEVSTPLTDFDSHPGVIGTPTGYVTLPDPHSGEKEIVLSTPNPDLLVTKMFGAGFDINAKCPMWERAMEQALPNRETRRYLQKVLGQALFGRQDEHLLVVFEGDGGNGKGFTVDVLRAIFGDYAADLMVSVFTLAGMGNHATEKMPFKGARIAFTDEIPPQQLNMDMVKKTTGGGTLPARGVNENQTEFELTHLQIFLTNNRLQWPPSAMAAVRRRMRVFKFGVQFGAPGNPPKISGLDRMILAEEAAGVLNWLLGGYSMYLEEGIGNIDDAPSEVQGWTADTLAASSTWSAFCALAFEATESDSDFIESAAIFPVWDKFRAEDTDQRHVSPGSARVVAGMVAQQVQGTAAVPGKSHRRAGVARIRWSAEGAELREAAMNPLGAFLPPRAA